MADIDRVLIIGGGPVGTVTGFSLARKGIPVTVFDRLAQPATDHRAATLHPSTLDLLAPLGLTAGIEQLGLRSRHFQWRDRETQEVVAEFDYSLLAGESAHPYVIQLEQHKTIAVARAAAAQISAFTLICPVEVTAVRQFDDRVEADIKHADGRAETHAGRYLIGCDGGRSLVRKTIDVTFDGFTWAERFNIVTTTIDFSHWGFRKRNYCAHPDRWVSLIKVPGPDRQGLWRTIFPVRPSETDEEVMSDGWIRARVAECLPAPAAYDIIHRNLYDVHQRVAGKFRHGRIVLAGDAAHINNPIGGMGMNSGFHDGLNVADKLEAIWNGAAPDPLLDRYDRQRRVTATEFVQAQSIANKRTLEERDPETRRENLDALRRTAADRDAHLAFVRRASLITMLQRAEEIA